MLRMASRVVAVLRRAARRAPEVARRDLTFRGAPRRCTAPAAPPAGAGSWSLVKSSTSWTLFTRARTCAASATCQTHQGQKPWGVFGLSAPRTIRTCDLRIRSPMLYPAELGARGKGSHRRLRGTRQGGGLPGSLRLGLRGSSAVGAFPRCPNCPKSKPCAAGSPRSG